MFCAVCDGVRGNGRAPLNHLQDSSFRLITFSAAMIAFVVSEEDILRVEKKTEGS